ncbi:MAG: 3-deoxy-manno-octulosonate cytidylyltransferase [Candidatus Babeliales bacterium]|jgi:3-deoxy-manno-octulosonate cytidylyltransferase (CMP-KDO synthetase)
MNKQKKIICIIPARLDSVRFPRKVIAPLKGRPLLAWVWDAVTRCTLFDEVFFAIDSHESAAVIEDFGGRYVMTSPTCKSGTDRLVELCVSGKLTADIWVNWQGDEPFVNESMVATLLQTSTQDDQDMWTLKKLITDPNDIHSSKIAKVVCDSRGQAIYFSRAPIPFFRDEHDPIKLVAKETYYKHVGLYAYTASALNKIAVMGKSILEDAEKLEQLRFLEHGLRIQVHETTHDVFGIDTPEDLLRAERRIANV